MTQWQQQQNDGWYSHMVHLAWKPRQAAGYKHTLVSYKRTLQSRVASLAQAVQSCVSPCSQDCKSSHDDIV